MIGFVKDQFTCIIEKQDEYQRVSSQYSINTFLFLISFISITKERKKSMQIISQKLLRPDIQTKARKKFTFILKSETV